jgi:leucine dehydrogenase
MNVFAQLREHGHEQVVYCYEPSCGLRAIIAIHDTTLGPSLGGCRMWDYASEEEALYDVLRLSKGMTYKASVAGLNLGGGKAVIMGDPKKQKSEALFRQFGRFVDSLGGRYITAEDVGTSVLDMEWIAAETKYVTGIAVARGGSGDPSPVTAYGIYKGIQACVKHRSGSKDLKGLRVAIQGLGKVGYYTAKHIIEDGARVVGCDIDKEKARRAQEELGVEVVSPEEIFDVDCDVFAPCALGAVLNDRTIPRLRCSIVAGGANNQLEEERHGDELERRGILYAPDFVINAGGLINVYCEIDGYNRDRAMRMAEQICPNLLRVFAIAKEERIPTHRAAELLAERRIESVRKLRRL